VTEPVVRSLEADDDVEQLGRLIQNAYRSLAGYPRDDEYDAHIADVEGRRRDTIVVVAELDGRLVGSLTYVAGVVEGHSEHGDPDAASFRYFAVDPAVQGRGVGEAMVRWVIDRARSDGKRAILIHTLDVMRGAQRLYRRLGFVRDEAHDEDWDGIAGLAYRYDL
jgi:GNAT superfamily N-acetyltransferase